MSKILLITGATGKQGKELIRALYELPERSEFEIYGVSRNTKSSSCAALAAKYPELKFVEGDLKDGQSMLDAVGKPVWGVFAVLSPMGDGQTPATEESYGKALIDAALKSGVKHFVYSSVERNGDFPTNVPHFISKHEVEMHLKNNTGNMSWTILRPTSFMDNSLGTTFFNKILGAVWKWHLGMDGKRQFIACRDIGIFAARAFAHSQAFTYHNRAIGLAGDSLSFREADFQMKKILGRGLPATYWLIVPLVMQTAAGSTINKMYTYFRDVGFHVDVEALRKDHPGLLTFQDFLEQSVIEEGIE